MALVLSEQKWHANAHLLADTKFKHLNQSGKGDGCFQAGEPQIQLLAS